MVQSRMLGGALGLSVVTAAFTSFIRTNLDVASFTPAEVASLLKTSKAFGGLQIERASYARAVFAAGYNLQMKIVAGFAAAQIPTALLLWRKEQFTLPQA